MSEGRLEKERGEKSLQPRGLVKKNKSAGGERDKQTKLGKKVYV